MKEELVRGHDNLSGLNPSTIPAILTLLLSI